MNTSHLITVQELLFWFEIAAGIAIALGIVTIFFLGKTLFEMKVDSKKNSDMVEAYGTLFVLQKEAALLRVNQGTRRVQIEEMTYSVYTHLKFTTSKDDTTKKPAPGSKPIIVDSKEIRASYDKYAMCNS